MKNVVRVVRFLRILIVLMVYTCLSMSEDETPKTHQEWKLYITDEQNTKQFHPYYFYEPSSLTLLEEIAAIDKKSEELSDDTLDVIQALVQQCSVKFDKSVQNPNNKQEIIGINKLLESQSKAFNNVKKLQIFSELLRAGTEVGKPEYFFWLLQALYTYNAEVTCYFIDYDFSAFVSKPQLLDNYIYDSFYDYMFVMIKQLCLTKPSKNNGEQIRMLHFLLATAEGYLDTALQECKKSNSTELSDLQQQRYNFLKKQKENLLLFLRSKGGYECLLVALCNGNWDFVDYCLERKKQRIGVTNASDVLSFIITMDKKKFSLEEKSVLIRHFINRAQQQKTHGKLIAFDNYLIIGQIAGCGLTSLLNYVLYSGIDLNNFDKGKNIFAYFLKHSASVYAKECMIVVKELIQALRTKDVDALLNPHTGVIPLSLLMRKGSLKIFKDLMTLGARPWHANGHIGGNMGIRANVCALTFLRNHQDLKKIGAYLEPSERWQFVQAMVEYAEQQGALNKLFNKKGHMSPLLFALTDEDDKNFYTGGYFIKKGARYTPEMLQEIVTGNFFNNEAKKLGLENLIKRVPEDEFIGLLDPLLADYSPKHIWKLMEVFEASHRNDKTSCLYALFKYCSPEAYQTVKKRRESGESKKIIIHSLGIMKKIEKSLNENQIEYNGVHTNNIRYSELKPQQEQKKSDFRGKYAFLL